MVRIIVGDAGSGKTKQMIKSANESVANTNGTIVYIDATEKHMNQLHRDIRFISLEGTGLNTFDHLYGFICGLNSANYDIEEIYMDGLIKTIENGYDNLLAFLNSIEPVAEKHDVKIYISTTITDENLLQKLNKFILD